MNKYFILVLIIFLTQSCQHDDINLEIRFYNSTRHTVDRAQARTIGKYWDNYYFGSVSNNTLTPYESIILGKSGADGDYLYVEAHDLTDVNSGDIVEPIIRKKRAYEDLCDDCKYTFMLTEVDGEHKIIVLPVDFKSNT